MLNVSIDIAQKRYSLDTNRPYNLSIPLRLDGSGPTHFGVDPLKAKPLKVGEFTGDVASGGSCNVDQLKLVAHCQGTHTETKAHIDRTLCSAFDLQLPFVMPCLLISIMPESADTSEEHYYATQQANDLIITKKKLEKRLESQPKTRALVIRTLPNSDSKLHANYQNAETIAYLSTDAIRYLLTRGVEHLLIDTPSIDRIYDEGFLANHKIFWGIEDKKLKLKSQAGRDHCTITEMIFAPNAAADGLYGLQLSCLRWHTDAVPSTAVIYPLEETTC